MNKAAHLEPHAPRHHSPRILVVAFSIMAAVTAAMGALWMTVPTSATTPGTPGTAQASTPVYSEDFSNQAASPAIALGAYTGSAGTSGADSETYGATGGYRSSANQCDGWILNSTTPIESSDSGCTTTAWTHLQGLADILGQAQGQSATAAASNQVLSEYTNDKSNNPGAGYELETNANTIPAIAGHFYTVSGYFAEENCGASHAKENLSLVLNGTPTQVGTNLDPCTAANAKSYSTTIGGTQIGASVADLISNALQLPATGTPTLGVDVYDAQTSGDGNDGAFDLPQITDVTPQLDKAFSPTLIAPGGTSTLTYTITNTNELDAKDGWSFTDDLPSNVTATGVNTTTCTNAKISAASGGTIVSVTNGDLNAGQTSCTVSVGVTSSVSGTYTNSAANFPTNGGLVGLNPPGSTPLVVNEVDLSITKVAKEATYHTGSPITYTVTVANAGPSTATNATVTDALPTSITVATWTCTASSGATCTAKRKREHRRHGDHPSWWNLDLQRHWDHCLWHHGRRDQHRNGLAGLGNPRLGLSPSPGAGCSSSVTTPSASSPTTTTTDPPVTTTTVSSPALVDPATSATTTTTEPAVTTTTVQSTTPAHQNTVIVTGHAGPVHYLSRSTGFMGAALATAALAMTMFVLRLRRRRSSGAT